jgi:hypothetical protein
MRAVTRKMPSARAVRNILLPLLLLFGASYGANAATGGTPAEINHLLVYLESSGCDFYRNGSWHEPKQARAHLEKKYRYLEKRALIGSTEDFISRGASASSMSGEKYLVRCSDGRPVSSAVWLSAELKRYRSRLKP